MIRVQSSRKPRYKGERIFRCFIRVDLQRTLADIEDIHDFVNEVKNIKLKYLFFFFFDKFILQINDILLYDRILIYFYINYFYFRIYKSL